MTKVSKTDSPVSVRAYGSVSAGLRVRDIINNTVVIAVVIAIA